MRNGAVFTAYGEKAIFCANRAKEALHRTDPDLPVQIMNNHYHDLTDVQCSRLAKVSLLNWSPFEQTAYLDADTIPYQSIAVGFEILADGFDLVITPSNNQGDELLWHVGQDDKAETLNTTQSEPLQLQAGVFWVARNARTKKLFAAWRVEWEKYQNQDQGAFLRALYANPVKVWLLGRAYNGGACIAHRFGEC